MSRLFLGVLLSCTLALSSCHRSGSESPKTVVVIIESSPVNLDPRIGTDAQSERMGELLFDPLVRRDEHFNVQPAVAESWEIPDPTTYIFHLRQDVHFHDGTPLTSRDVKWTIDSMLDGTIISLKTSTYKGHINRIDTPDPATLVIHLNEPFTSLLWNLSDGAFGIVPFGSGKDFYRAPVGSGPFRYVSAEQDNEVILQRNPDYWGAKPKIERVRFAVVPDDTTRALELRKGSGDIAINAMSADMVEALRKQPQLEVQITPGTAFTYLAFNLRDPILKDVRVRQALAYGTDRNSLIHYLWRDEAEVADSILPRQHWAYDAELKGYPHDPARARKILDDAGYREKNGVRFHITMKTSTVETTRLLAAVLQQQWREIGVVLDIRSYEFATFYNDVVKGAFQVYSLRWFGGNEDPDIFEDVFHSASFPPKRANRSYYANARVDQLIDEGRSVLDQNQRKKIYAEVQQLLARDLPYINLWYLDNVVVHSKRVRNLRVSPSGNYDFLKTAELAQ
jgi:peptide/nickel transport system substrate-binding protein